MPMADPLTRTLGRGEAATIPATRFLVTRARLLWIFSFLSAVQRPFAIDSPMRLTTASTAARAFCGGGPDAWSQARTLVAGSWPVAVDGLRERTVTSSPRASRRLTRYLPMN